LHKSKKFNAKIEKFNIFCTYAKKRENFLTPTFPFLSHNNYNFIKLKNFIFEIFL